MSALVLGILVSGVLWTGLVSWLLKPPFLRGFEAPWKHHFWMRVYAWKLNVCFVRNTVFLKVLGMPGFKMHFLSIQALERLILRGLERLVKSAKVKRLSARAVLLAA